MMKYILIVLFLSAGLSAQDSTKIVDPNTNFNIIEYYDYIITITSEKDEFFKGKLESVKNGKKVFGMEGVFTDYVSHRIIDMDGNGSDELVLNVSEGASPYIFGTLYIFDVTKGAEPQCMLTNAELDTTDSKKPRVSTFTRMSPSILGLVYHWLMDYKYGKLYLTKSDSKRLSTQLTPDDQSILYKLNDLQDYEGMCSDGSYNTFFETLFIQYKIAGEEGKAEDFFNRHYKCPNKQLALDQMKNAAADTYSWLNDPTNFKYGE